MSNSKSEDTSLDTARMISDLMWKFHNDRLDNPNLIDMTPYIKPIQAYIKEQQANLLQVIEDEAVTYRHSYTVEPKGYVETEAIPLEVIKKLKDNVINGGSL